MGRKKTMLAAGLTPELKDQREGHGGTTSEPETQQSQRRARREAVGDILSFSKSVFASVTLRISFCREANLGYRQCLDNSKCQSK